MDDPKLIPSEVDVKHDVLLPMSELLTDDDTSWIFSHSIVELSTALKAKALVHLLSKDDCDQVLYFDPDMCLFSTLDDLTDTFSKGDILLTPHLTSQEDNNDIIAISENEISCLKHGSFNLGFIGVKNSLEGMKFAKWWESRTHLFCKDDIPNGLFTDQKWIDLVPSFFHTHFILRNERFNVATWNYSTRKLSGTISEGLMVNDEKLGFYHFTGFDSGAHEIMASKYAALNETSKELIQWYKESLATYSIIQKPWKYGYFSNGQKIQPLHRLIYTSINQLKTRFPDPYNASGKKGFYNWVKYRMVFFRFFPKLITLYQYQSRHANKSFYSIIKSSIAEIGVFKTLTLVGKFLTK